MRQAPDWSLNGREKVVEKNRPFRPLLACLPVHRQVRRQAGLFRQIVALMWPPSGEIVCRKVIVGGVGWNFGGPCRGRTYGPLIKSGNRAIYQWARFCDGFPIFFADQALEPIPRIRLCQLSHVIFDGFYHKFITGLHSVC